MSLCLVPDVDDLFDLLFGDRVEATVEGMVELEVLHLRTIHVHQRGSRGGEALKVGKPCTCCQGSCRKANCTSSVVASLASWYQPSLFDGCSELRKPDMVELIRSATFDAFLREEI